MVFQKKLIFVFLILVVLTIAGIVFVYKSMTQNTQYVLSSVVSPTQPVATPLPTEKPTITPTPTIALKKQSYIIALFGDSMVDTMGEKAQYLQSILQEKYPGVEFNLYNYGIGSQNAEQGFARFYSEFKYKERNFSPISQINADVIILGSFAYNPFDPYVRDRHWIALKSLIQEAKKTSAKIYVLSEIAPLQTGFGKGPNGVNWDEPTAHAHSLHIIEQLENAINLAREQNVGIIDTFNPSKISGNFGRREFVSTNDGIHPSEDGHIFMAQIIAETLEFD